MATTCTNSTPNLPLRRQRHVTAANHKPRLNVCERSASVSSDPDIVCYYCGMGIHTASKAPRPSYLSFRTLINLLSCFEETPLPPRIDRR